ncbi:hypothetical protein CHS0354_035408 [Potamilus streckersoni]|uniref:5'-nucleotidase n=1 Tax=Potamilus streckersoni TaxID=2493646 RepID=A0AAE0TEU1_9BIVA|nr:hypothetical protein CHS0354_035408 [Potamilus streckersoni]
MVGRVKYYIYLIFFGSRIRYGCGLDVTILHTNDVHAHYEEMGKYYGNCDSSETAAGQCTGGVTRYVTSVNKIRATQENVILLDAGDRFTGTLWFTQYQGLESSHFMRQMKYDAMCLGNHEFDLGVEGLVRFLDNVTFPVLSANTDVSKEPRLQGKFSKSAVKELPSGDKVGIIGFTTKETAYTSNAGPTVKFSDEIIAIGDEAARLTSQGVQILIGLGHAGYITEQDIAKAIPSLDLVIGGHSHTFLYSGSKPSTEPIEGPYPTVVVQDDGRKVPVVTAFAWGKYLGRIDITFNSKGEAVNWTGNPILLNNSVEQDNATLQEVQQMAQPLKELKNKIIGTTAVHLDGDRMSCRLRECNLGNLITDAIIEFHLDKRNDNETWGAAAMAIWNGGGIRGSIKRGKVSLGDVYTVLPFANIVDKITISGFYLRQTLEQSIANYDPKSPAGGFLQMSGIRVLYNLQKPKGSRVVSAYVRCHKCEHLEYSSLDNNTIYSVLTPEFLLKGGDGYKSLLENQLDHVRLNSLDTDVLQSFISKRGTVYAETEGRISFQSMNDEKCNDINGANPNTRQTYIILLVVLMYIL